MKREIALLIVSIRKHYENKGQMTIGGKDQILFELMKSDLPKELRNLNFYLGGQLISNEPIYVPTYIASFERFLDLLTNGRFQNSELAHLTLEQRYKKLELQRGFEESQYFKHLFQLDETIDQFTIFVFQASELTEFVWACWDKYYCNAEHTLNQIYSICIPTKELISTVNILTEELKKGLSNNRYE